MNGNGNSQENSFPQHWESQLRWDCYRKPKQEKRLLVVQLVTHSISDCCDMKNYLESLICYLHKKRLRLAEKDETVCQLSISFVQLVEGE